MFLYSPLAREGLDQLMKEKSPAINGIVISICWFGVHAHLFLFGGGVDGETSSSLLTFSSFSFLPSH
jgi:hypothetical protein